AFALEQAPDRLPGSLGLLAIKIRRGRELNVSVSVCDTSVQTHPAFRIPHVDPRGDRSLAPATERRKQRTLRENRGRAFAIVERFQRLPRRCVARANLDAKSALPRGGHDVERIDERLAWIVSRGDGSECETRRESGRQVLQRMHRDVDALLEQRVFNLFGEESRSFQLVQRSIDLRITLRLDHHELRLHAVLGEPSLHPFRLPARKLAAARADPHANRRASMSTSPGTVCGSASMISRKPSSRAVPAVTGPMVAVTNRPDVAAGPTRFTNERTVDDDVNVTASMRPR